MSTPTRTADIPCLPPLLSAKGTIRNDTFRSYESRCTFQLRDVEITFPALSDDAKRDIIERIRDAQYVYWSQMGNFLPVVEYIINFQNAKQRTYKGKLQYHIDKDHMYLADKTLMHETATKNHAWKNVMTQSNHLVDEGVLKLLRVANPDTIKSIKLVKAKSSFANLAEVFSELHPTYVEGHLDEQSFKLYKILESDPLYFSVRGLLSYYDIVPPSPADKDNVQSSNKFQTIRETTCDLAVALIQNPYVAHYQDNISKFREFKNLSFEKLEKIALDRFGPQIVKDTSIIPFRYAAAISSILIQHEQNTGATTMTIAQVKRMLITRIHQSQLSVEDTLAKFGKHILPYFAVEDIQNQEISDTIRLQHPSARSREDLILSWMDAEKQTDELLPLYNPRLLEQILMDVYGKDKPRDPDQIRAIHTILQSPVSLVSGPPGSGKTTFVLRVITRYIEQLYSEHTLLYEEQYADREHNDQLLVAAELRKFMKNVYQKYSIHGCIDELITTDNDFNTIFAEIYDELVMNTKTGNGKSMSVKGFRFACQQKYWTALKPKSYRLTASRDLGHVKMMAPSGVASRRLKDACDNHSTHTCCSLLGQLTEDSLKKMENRDFFPFAMMVVDEASMIEESTLTNLIRIANRFSCQLLLIGDHNQLPPIGTGQVFRDLLRYSSLPKVQLTNIYRQGAGSNIAKLSREIVSDSPDEPSNRIRWIRQTFVEEESRSWSALWNKVLMENQDCEIVGLSMSSEFVDFNHLTAHLYTQLVFEKGWKTQDVQILTPFKGEEEGGRAGLNTEIQKQVAKRRVLQNEGRPINQPHARFFALDPVIHRQNMKTLDIFNGDQGYVLPVHDRAQYVLQNLVPVQYPHQLLDYTTSEDPRIYDLELAYALTAHLAQGSQYTVVIVVLAKYHIGHTTQLMLNTLISRAKTKLFILTKDQVWDNVITDHYKERETRLGITS